MKPQLIKLTEEHYILIDDSEILGNGEWLYCLVTATFGIECLGGVRDLRTAGQLYKSCRINEPSFKVTEDYTTEPFESWGYINNQGEEQYIHYPDEMMKVIYSTLPLDNIPLIPLNKVEKLYKSLIKHELSSN